MVFVNENPVTLVIGSSQFYKDKLFYISWQMVCNDVLNGIFGFLLKSLFLIKSCRKMVQYKTQKYSV